MCITWNYPKWIQALLAYNMSALAVIQTRLICHTRLNPYSVTTLPLYYYMQWQGRCKTDLMLQYLLLQEEIVGKWSLTGRSCTTLPNNISLNYWVEKKVSLGWGSVVRQWAELHPAEQLKPTSYTPFIMKMLQRHLITVHIRFLRHFAELSEHTTHLLIGLSCWLKCFLSVFSV